MLGKLLKYETRATARWFLPMYAGIVVFALINKLFISIPGPGNVDANNLSGIWASLYNMLNGITVLFYVLIIIATFILTFFIMLQRFYKNLLGDEGYLMFTLPVKPSSHILSKLIVSAMWTVASVIVTLLSIMILGASSSMFYELGKIFNEMMDVMDTYLGVHAVLFFIELIVLMLVALVQSNLMMYTAIALGHTRHNHKILYSFGFYMLLNFAQQVVSTIITVIGGMAFETDFLHMVQNNMPPFGFIHFIMISSIVLMAAFGVVFYFITNHILSKKLNLE